MKMQLLLSINLSSNINDYGILACKIRTLGV